MLFRSATIMQVRKTIAALDAPAAERGGAGERPIHVFPLKNAKANDTVPVLQKVFTGLAVTADERTNSLIIRADQETLTEVAKLLERLDIPVPEE